MAKKLTATEKYWNSTVLTDIFEAGGLIKSSPRDYGYNAIKENGYVSAAATICDEIKYRKFDFPAADEAIKVICKNVTFIHLYTRKTVTAEEKDIARAIASFCAANEIFWDDVNTRRTTVEMDTYRMGPLGSACWEFNCFLSQQTSKKPAKSSTGGTSKAYDYKSSGPKSGLISGLIGKPGEKILIPGTFMFDILCKSTKSKKQFVYIDPIRYRSTENKVLLGDPSGYSTCKLFFESPIEAEAAIRAINDGIDSGKFKVPADLSGFSGLEVMKTKVDSNGYFKVNTEVGPAYIKASKLNEAIDADLAEEVESKEIRKSRYPEINNIDTYSEAFQRYE